MSPITRSRDTFAKPGVDPRVVERIQGINVETGRLTVGRSGKEFYAQQQPADVVCYIAGEDFDLPPTCRPEGEVGVAVVGDQCMIYGDIRIIDGDSDILEFNLPSEARPLFSVERSMVTNKNAEPPDYAPFSVFSINGFDSFDVNTLVDPDKWITKDGEDAVVSEGHVVGDWIGMMVDGEPSLASRTTVKFRKTNSGSVDIVAAVRSQWKLGIEPGYNLWGIWGRYRSDGIELYGWGDDDASHDGPLSETASFNIDIGVDYWLRTTIDDVLSTKVELFNAHPSSAADPLVSMEKDFSDNIEEFPALANLKAPGQAGAHNQSSTPNVYIDYVMYEIPKLVNEYNTGVMSLSDTGKLSIIVPNGSLYDGTLIKFGQLQYIKK